MFSQSRLPSARGICMPRALAWNGHELMRLKHVLFLGLLAKFFLTTRTLKAFNNDTFVSKALWVFYFDRVALWDDRLGGDGL
jgi:hypothetical protein